MQVESLSVNGELEKKLGSVSNWGEVELCWNFN